MHWLIRPAIGWGAWLLLHSVVIPAVYAAGKGCGRKEAWNAKYGVQEQSAGEIAE